MGDKHTVQNKQFLAAPSETFPSAFPAWPSTADHPPHPTKDCIIALNNASSSVLFFIFWEVEVVLLKPWKEPLSAFDVFARCLCASGGGENLNHSKGRFTLVR